MPLISHGTSTSFMLLSLSTTSVGALVVAAIEAPPLPSEQVERRNNNPLNIDWSPAPPPDQGPPGAANALRNPAYLPVQIGGIVGSYAFSLVLVAIVLLSLSKKRRDRIRAAEDFDQWEETPFELQYPEPYPHFQSQDGLQLHLDVPKGHIQDHIQGSVQNFSLPSPGFSFKEQTPYTLPSPDGSLRGQPGVDPFVDQSIVQHDKAMAQSQLEEMYKYVMEQEAAKEAGVDFKAPAYPAPSQQRSVSGGILKKERAKPANLNLADDKSEKTQSRASSFLSALKSPLGKKKDKVQALSISSPIMTPMSGTFPQYIGEEMSAIPPRQYAPAMPPPVPANQVPYQMRRDADVASMTPPDQSPESTQSIDERLRAMSIKGKNKDVRFEEDDEEEEEAQAQTQTQDSHYHHTHLETASMTEPDPVSAVSESSTAPLFKTDKRSDRMSGLSVGLPSSPKPGVTRFPSLASLPSSPKPGATFSRPNAPSAVRTGGTLPLRAYEPPLMSPNTYDRTVKQTVFERNMPQTPGLGTARTPRTGAPVPYSPYQPFSPVIPITPSLVTKADRKRMRRMEPKTPTLDLVRDDDEIW